MQNEGKEHEGFITRRRFRHTDIGREPIQAQAHGGSGRDADFVAHHEAVQPPRFSRVHHLRGLQAARHQGIFRGLLPAHVGHYIRLHQWPQRHDRPPQHLRALEGNSRGHRVEHHDGRSGEAGEGLRRGRALYADLWRRGVRPGCD